MATSADSVAIEMQPKALDDASSSKDSHNNDAVSDIDDKTVNSSNSPLQIACFDGRHKDVDTILSSCPGEQDKRKMLDAIDHDNGYTPLHTACEKEHTEVVKVLIKHGANPDICSHKDPLYQRLKEGSEDIEIILDDSDKSKVEYYKNTKDIIESLLADEVPVYNLKCIDQSSKISYNMSSQFFVGSTPIHVAAKNGSVKVLKVLLSNDLTQSQIKCDINCTDTYKRTALYIASKEGHAPVVKLLLEHGADIDNFADAYSRTALHIACEVGHVQVVELLLEYTTKINLSDDFKRTALHIASDKGYAREVELLLEHGADIRLNDDDEHTAIYIACEKGHAQIVELLLQRGADIKPIDVTYNKEMLYARLLHIACKNGHAKVVELLLMFGADITNCDENGLNPLDTAVEEGKLDVAMAIVNSTKWKDALRSIVMNRSRDERRNRIMKLLCYNKTEPEFTTPMRRIINKMPDVAKIIFDRCCKTEASPDHPDYKITFNFEFLEDFDLDVNHESTKWPPQFDYSSQNHCLNILANSRSADLLKHPLARTLLNLKWNKYGKIFYYTNLMIYFIFVILLTSFALSLRSPNSSICMEAFGNDTNCSEEGSVDQRYLSVASVLLIIISVLMILREVFQVILLRLQYLMGFVNFIEVPLFIFTIMFASVGGNHCYCTHSWQWQIGVIAVFLGWIALIFSIRKLPKFGIYVVMFIEIFKNFMKVVILALLLIFAFAFPLYMMFHDPQLDQKEVEFILPMEEFLKKIVAKYIVIKQEQTMYPNKSGVLKQLIGYIFESKTEGSEPPPATIADVNTQIKPLSGEMKDLRTSVSQEVKKLHSSVSQEVKELRSSVDHLLAIVESMRNERARELSSETIGIRGSIGAKDRAKIEEEQGDF
ncbi:PREDICTED: transient receptor potential cation channel subfamily A member 1 homolog [Amphimedon queenslandica]|uniref:Ion transport domain-containing protein n=1 Tax=Amphimedon queenslandica TaxID=400682 RepID=A0AAN0JSF3_AMPQE|nr:PREDICTED: transient receptor potential cation channel subfamily A member 1 homolog [Amphimedon queenslandica]|eukprot:XP_019859811.1 PREDICTED: transient receptor potential cation channel subfamily A member 1 homolog [Amphimedon queenslandica]